MKRRDFLKTVACTTAIASPAIAIPKSETLRGRPIAKRMYSESSSWMGEVVLPWLPSRLVVDYNDERYNVIHQRIYTQPRESEGIESNDPLFCTPDGINGPTVPRLIFPCHLEWTKGYSGESWEYVKVSGTYRIDLYIMCGEHVTWTAHR